MPDNAFFQNIQNGPVKDALAIAFDYKEIDGAHHKDWVIDQMVRKLAGDSYEDFTTCHNEGEDGPNTYEWDEGIAP